MSRVSNVWPWAITAAVLAAIVCLAAWPRPTLGVLGIVVGTGAVLAGLRGLLAEHHSQAPTEPSDDPTAQETRDLADDRCCVCGGPETPYENYRGQLFCWPCADCPCGQIPCVRTGINDPAVSATAAADPDASGRAPETARTHPDASAEQAADQAGEHPDDARNRLRDAVAEAIMCGDHGCLTSHHLPTIAQLLGGVGLLEETAPTAVQVTPPLTGPMIPTDTPTCGTNLPATGGIPCGQPAAWHIRWATGDGDQFPAGLACQVHMDALAERHAWHERHAAGPDCGTRTANWQADRCTPEAEA